MADATFGYSIDDSLGLLTQPDSVVTGKNLWDIPENISVLEPNGSSTTIDQGVLNQDYALPSGVLSPSSGEYPSLSNGNGYSISEGSSAPDAWVPDNSFSGISAEEPSSFLGKMWAPIQEAASTTNAFLSTLMGEKTLGLVYGSAILAGAQGIAAYLTQERNMEYTTQQTQVKFAQDDKVRQEGYAREDEKRARTGVAAQQGVVTPKANAMVNYRAPGYAVSKQYGDIATKNRYGLLGG